MWKRGLGWLALVVLGLWAVDRYVSSPVRYVAVRGHFRHVNGQQLKAVIDKQLHQPLAKIPLSVVKEDLERLAWVEHADVERVWPDQLVVELSEPTPWIRWQNQAVIDREGRVFPVDDLMEFKTLPKLQCSQTQLKQGIELYRKALVLLDGQRLPAILALSADPQGVWSLWLAKGGKWVLGAEGPEVRLKRFLASGLPVLRKRGVRLAHCRVDLRYTGGFAVG